MPKVKVAATVEKDLLERLDRMVTEGRFPSCSSAVEQSIEECLEKVERTRLAPESVKPGPAFEQALADECIAGDLSEWPEYYGVKSTGKI